ncbi:MAG TPA: response regulator transcription factor [Opitutaceae bacterium]|nr:response regulator transcription factor [Opitutaceae bacterium]
MLNHCPTARAKLKVVLVEDSVVMREVLAISLASVLGVEIIAVAETAPDAIAACEGQRPDLVILDLALRVGSGLDVLREIKQRLPACRVLVFTGHDQLSYRQHCLGAGADFFFSKNRQQEDLIDQLHRLAGEAAAGA